MFLTSGLFHAAVDGDLEVLRPLEQLIVGGDVTSPVHVRRALAGLPGLRLIHGYGPTENTTFTTSQPLPGVGATTPIGRPLANTRVHVVDRSLRPVPIGVSGELLAGGDGLARGYFRRPAQTAERFVPDPFGRAGGRLYRTGDLVRFLPTGELDFLGRVDAQVKIRGFRVEPGEVESVLGQHPDLRDVSVVAVGGAGERSLVAYCVARRGDVTSADLKGFLRARLPEHLVPSVVVLIEALPLTSQGKVDRRALAARPLHDPEGEPRADEQAAPRTPTEELLANLFAALLGREEVGVTEDFFALGGHSLLATQVIARLRDALGVELPVAALFEQPTVAGLARSVAEARAVGRASAPPLERMTREGDPPLSFAQERLWFIDRLQPGNPAYNLPLALDCVGPLDAPALGWALSALSARHETLRTRFDLVDGRPVQRIDAPGPSALPLVDLAGLPAARREVEAGRLIAGESWRPFDLARGPLLRARLLRLAADRHGIVLALHHSIADGWSLGVLVRDLSAFYRAAASGAAAALPELPVQYADYAVWQRRWLAGAVLEGELAYWRDRLAGAPALLELPTDRPRPLVQSWRGASRPVRLGGALSSAVRGQCRRSGTTSFMVLAAGFFALLARHSGQEDVTLGVPIAGRTHLETEGLIGFFVNTLILRAELPGDRAFSRLVERIREDSLAAYEHQDLPFERLVEELRVERSLGHSPLFQAMFALQNAPTAELVLPGLELKTWPSPGGMAKFDLTFTLAETADGIGGTLGYATALFDAPTIDRLAEHFTALLAAAIAQPDRRLEELSLLAAAERQQLVAEWNDTAAAIGEDVVSLVGAWARSSPAAPAVEGSGSPVGYGELAARAGGIAARLRALGVEVEARVAVLAERSPATIVGYLAVLAAGGAYVALDPLQPVDRLMAMMEDAWQGNERPVLVARRALTVPFTEQLASRGVAVVDPEDPAEAAPFLPLPVPPASAAYVIYTSGSTGRPKGVVVSRGALANLVEWHLTAYGVGSADRSTLLAGTGFDASVWEIWPCLAAGGTLVIPDEETKSSPPRLVAWLAFQGITLCFLPTPLAEAVLAETWSATAVLRVLLTGGDRLHEGPRCDLPFRLINHYGPTESAVVATATEVTAGASLPPIGRPIGNFRVRLLASSGLPVPMGVAAELGVAGAGLARGYLGDPARTAERFVPDPLAAFPGDRLYRTGDLARWRPNGQLEFLGRRDDQVKIRGIRIELGEIEAALAAHPAVAAAAVAVSDSADDRRLAAYVVPRAGGLAASDLRSWLKQRLPPAMIPVAFVELAELPLTANGKLDRRALPEPEVGLAAVAEYVAPSNSMEEVLAEIWTELLGVPRVGASDSFFDLGGHSLQAIRLMGRLRDALGVDLQVRSIFEAPILSEFAVCVAAEMVRLLADQEVG